MTKLSSLYTFAAVGVLWVAFCGHARGALINHWKFDEVSGSTASDSGSNPLHLTLQGDAQFVTDGVRGQVLALDGVGDYANNSGQPFTSDITHTVAVWVNHFDAGNLSQRWISWGDVGARYFVGPFSGGGPSPGRIHWGFGSASAFFADPDAKPLQNTWQHWAFVRDGASASIYLDGELIETLAVPVSGSISTAGELRIGRQFGTNFEYLNGRMDDLAIWDEALTAYQINQAMNLGAENYLVPEPSSALLLITAALGVLTVLRMRRRNALCSRS